MRWPFRDVLAIALSISLVVLLSSCSRMLPTFVKLDDGGALSFALCYPLDKVTSVELTLTNPVVGDPRSFEQNVVKFTGPPFDLAEGQPITLPSIAADWTSHPDFAEFADWTNGSIALITEDGHGASSDNFGKANLTPGVWVQLGSDFEGCSAPD